MLVRCLARSKFPSEGPVTTGDQAKCEWCSNLWHVLGGMRSGSTLMRCDPT
jgi:hypothetical protein